MSLVLMACLFATVTSSAGCGESSTDGVVEPQPVIANVVENISNQDPLQLQEQPEKPVAKPEEGVLQQAGDLFEKAKNTSGETAKGAGQWVQQKLGSVAAAGDRTADETWEWANETFESLKEQGLTTAGSTSEWLGQDWNNMESWEYQIVTIDGTDEELTEKLTTLGKQGWECFDTQDNNDGTRFFFKKPTFSYLRHMPFKDLIKLVPLMSDGEK